jgi:GTPase SAR1 family protein
MGYCWYVTFCVVGESPSNTQRHPFQGQEEFDRLRSLSYAETHVVMMCFSVSLDSDA